MKGWPISWYDMEREDIVVMVVANIESEEETGQFIFMSQSSEGDELESSEIELSSSAYVRSNVKRMVNSLEELQE